MAKSSQVPWVPSRMNVVEEMLHAARIGPKDVVFDLGAGDGRIPITAAAHYGCRAIGIEDNMKMVNLARKNVNRHPNPSVKDLVEIRKENFDNTDLSEATVVCGYLLPQTVEDLLAKWLALKPGTRLVLHDYQLVGWQWERLIQIANEPDLDFVYLYVAPLKMAYADLFADEE